MRKRRISFSERMTLKRANINIGRGFNHRFYLKDTPVSVEPYAIFGKKNNTLWDMGAFSYTHSTLPADTIVGRYCSIAENVRPMGHQHPLTRFTTSVVSYENRWNVEDLPFELKGPEEPSPIVIGNDVWIGRDAVLKPGVIIGDGAVIASNAIVTKDVPPYAIVAGIPAKVVRYRFSEEVISKLLELQWWKYSYLSFSSINVDMDIESFIEQMSKLIRDEHIVEYEPKKIIL